MSDETKELTLSQQQDKKILKKQADQEKKDSEEEAFMDIEVEKKRKREESVKKNKPEKSKTPVTKRDPNIRELPDIVKPLVNKNDEEYVVKGDGPCLLRTVAAHISGYEHEGLQYARNLNTHLATYRPYYKEKISADFPLLVTISVKGETKLFHTCDEYFDWLAESKEAVFMWRGCVDVLAISNMAHMEIYIVVHEDGMKPELQTYKPDPEFPWLEEDKMKPKYKNELQQGKMSVLNWKNVHFNLIVSQTHMLSQLGSLGFQVSNQASVQEPSGQVDRQAVKDGDNRSQGNILLKVTGEKETLVTYKLKL